MKDPKTWESKEILTNKLVWHFCYDIKEIGIKAEGSDYNKKKAQQFASQKFLKQFFPSGYTWNSVVEMVLDKKMSKEMTAFLEEKTKMLKGEE